MIIFHETSPIGQPAISHHQHTISYHQPVNLPSIITNLPSTPSPPLNCTITLLLHKQLSMKTFTLEKKEKKREKARKQKQKKKYLYA